MLSLWFLCRLTVVFHLLDSLLCNWHLLQWNCQHHSAEMASCNGCYSCFLCSYCLAEVPWTLHCHFHLNWEKHIKENHFYSSSDSDSEDDEPRRFHIEIKPVQPNNSSQYTMPSLDELKVSIGNIALSPATSVSNFVLCIFNVKKSHKESLL